MIQHGQRKDRGQCDNREYSTSVVFLQAGSLAPDTLKLSQQT